MKSIKNILGIKKNDGVSSSTLDKGKKKKSNVPRTSQQTIPYRMAYDDGIIETYEGKYTRTIMFDDINYQVARQEDKEDIFVRYCDFMNYFNSTIGVQITINNKSVNQISFQKEMLLKAKGDHLDEYRKEYNDMLKHQMLAGKNDIQKEKYITLSITANAISEARNIFSRLESDVLSLINRFGSHGKVLSLKERLELLHDIYRNGHEGEFIFDLKASRRKGLITKDLIAPDSFEFKRDHMRIGDKYARAIFIMELPTFLNDGFLSELTDFSFNMLLNINIRAIEPHIALKMIKHQITGMEANKIDYQKRGLRSGYLEAFIPYELRHSLEEAQELLDDIVNKNQKMYLTNIIIVHMADTKESLDKDTEVINAVARKYICQMGTLNYQQEDALNSVVPLGVNRLKIDRCLTTESTAIFVPFTSQELVQKDGMYYGLNAVSKKVIMFNRKSLKNANGFILGSPGSGKSFSAKREMVNVLLNTDDDVIIIDPEREYTRLVENFEGQVIYISAGSSNYINPLDMTMDYSDDEEPLMLKSDFVLSLCEVIVGGRDGLSPKEKSIIDRCLKMTYREYMQDFDIEKIPTLKDFYEILKRQKEAEAENLATALELYTTGNLSVFSNKTNININNRLICYDIKDLGKQLKTMGMLIVLDAIWNRITQNRNKGKRTWLYMDEIYLLFANEYSANFLFELYKRARKWGAIPTGITQNIEDLLKSDLARRMLSNSEFLLLLNQSPSDRAELSKLLNISPAQLSYVTNSDAGQGLLFSGTSIVPFVDKFPTDTKLYQMMTTKVEEVSNISKSKKTRKRQIKRRLQ
ncbi:MAG: ATP-binding protein [Clostridia bacterium]|nr:ATP-binding protein [Clostridia bacterium]